MIICVDLDNCISADPAFYRKVMSALKQAGVEVHVLSGTHTDQVTTQEIAFKLSQLATLGFAKGRDYDEAIAVPGPEKDVPANKVAYMRHVGASALVDDERPNIRAARKAGFLGLRHFSPK